MPPPFWIFLSYFLSSCHVSQIKSKCTANQYISHMNLNCVYKSQEKGYFLMEIPQRRVLAGIEFRTCDLLTQIFLDLQPYLLKANSFLPTAFNSGQPGRRRRPVTAGHRAVDEASRVGQHPYRAQGQRQPDQRRRSHPPAPGCGQK